MVCAICGCNHGDNTECPPENFAYLECSSCKTIIKMALDAAIMMTDTRCITGCQCGEENQFVQISSPTKEQMERAA